jgi:uncharacterized membrane protein
MTMTIRPTRTIGLLVCKQLTPSVNTLWDGLFHVSTYLFVVLGLLILWGAAHRTHVRWSGKLLAGTMFMGFGLFHLV